MLGVLIALCPSGRRWEAAPRAFWRCCSSPIWEMDEREGEVKQIRPSLANLDLGRQALAGRMLHLGLPGPTRVLACFGDTCGRVRLTLLAPAPRRVALHIGTLRVGLTFCAFATSLGDSSEHSCTFDPTGFAPLGDPSG